MNKDNENRNIWLGVVIAAGIIVWLIMSTGCRTTTDRKLEKEGHWPGYLIEPYYGPHDVRRMNNRDLDILLRNTYSDGWQDKERSMYGQRG